MEICFGQKHTVELTLRKHSVSDKLQMEVILSLEPHIVLALATMMFIELKQILSVILCGRKPLAEQVPNTLPLCSRQLMEVILLQDILESLEVILMFI